MDDLSCIKYDSEGGEALLRHEVSFLCFCERNEIPSDNIYCGWFVYTLDGHCDQWCCALPVASIHSYDHMIRDLIHAFSHYNMYFL